MRIHESDFGANNIVIDHDGDLLSIEMSYPPYTDVANQAGGRQVRQIEIEQCSARATDGIRVSYDYVRDGWVIEQPRKCVIDPSPDETDPEPDFVEDWDETAFVRAWARQEVGDIPWLDGPSEIDD